MASKSEKVFTYAVLLRAINVGGNNKLPMKDLVALMEKLGCIRPRHYIQSGNVVFQASAQLAKALPAKLASAIERDFELRVPVLLRSASELSALVANNPLLLAGKDPDALYVMFLADVPDPARVAALDRSRASTGEIALVGRDLFAWIPKGVADWKLTNVYVDRALQTVSTMRNWRTVLKLVEMCAE